MKKGTTLMMILSLLALTTTRAFAQEKESKVNWDLGGDLVSNYIWRGIKYGEGVNVQPYLELSMGNFSLGAWGSADFNGFGEMDFYSKYISNFGLSLGITDYYYTGSDWGNKQSHAFEVNAGYEIGILSLAGNIILNEASGAGSIGGDMYYEVGLNFNKWACFIGGGNGWHTGDLGRDFEITNIGVKTWKELKFSDSFSIPISASAILNPNTEQFYVVLSISI